MAYQSTPEQLSSKRKKVTPLESRRTAKSPTERGSAFLQELRLRISSLLQTTLDAERIVDYFYQEVQSAVAVDGLSYRHEVAAVEIRQGMREKHRAHYRLSTNEDYFGEIEFTRRHRFSENELIKLESLLDLFVYPMRNAMAYQEALRCAVTDPLTGVGNRLSLSNALRRELELCRRYDQQLSVLLMDIDRFKSVNDLYGHSVGDQILQSVAQITRRSLRDADSIYRMGGEEFLVLMANTSLADARLIGERIRVNIAQSDLDLGPEAKPDITVSIGAAEYQDGLNPDTLVQAADQAMYKAKRNGRNQVQVL